MKNRALLDRRSTLAMALSAVVTTWKGHTAWAQDSPPQTAAGQIKLVYGEVTVTAAEGASRPASVGMALHQGETITTGPDAELHAEMEDGAYLAARPNSRLQIVRYNLTGTAADRSWIDLIKGGLRLVTGWIGKSNPGAFRLRTPVATIGIRGTDFELQHFTAEDAPTPEEAGTHHLVYEGTTLMSTEEDDLEVPAGRAAFALASLQAPQLHAEVPRFLKRKRGKFDAQIDERAASIKEAIMAKLEQKSLAATGETLAERLERFRLENPESALSDEDVMKRVARRAARRAANNRNGSARGGGRGGGGGRR